jgi:alpha-beta hydrolase superfamily lysophospholipase
VILEVQDMIQHASKISGDVTLCEIHNGLHDLVLSEKAVREQVYQQLFEWLQTKGL